MHTEATGLQGESDEDEQDDFGGNAGLDDSSERYVCCQAAAPAEGSACRCGCEDAPVFQVSFRQVVVCAIFVVVLRARLVRSASVFLIAERLLGSHRLFTFVRIGVSG
jgi:hypothetical protein